MLITRQHLPRRTVLRGLGAAIALPLLDGMVPAATALARTAAAPIRRFGAFYVPNGMAMAWWFPPAEGPLDALPPIAASLAPHRAQLLLLGGLDVEAANLVRKGGDHARAAGTFLSCVPFDAISDSNVIAAVTMGQVAARELGKATQLASLELAIESTDMLGTCDNTSCSLTNTIPRRGA